MINLKNNYLIKLIAGVICFFVIFNLSYNSHALVLKDSADNVCIFDLNHNIFKDMKGDFVAFVKSLNIDAINTENILCFSDNVNMTIEKFKNILVLAKENAKISGKGKAIYALSDNIDADIETNAACLIGKKVNVDGIINGDLTIIATKINLAETLVVNGNLKIKSPIQPTYPEGIEESLVTFISSEKEKDNNIINILVRLLTFLLWLAPSAIITVLIYIKLLGTVKKQGAMILKEDKLKVFLIGLLMIIVIPTLSFLCMIAIVGLQIALIIFMIYMICFMLSVPCFGVAIGELIWPNKSDYVSAILGTLLISLLVIIPYVGILVYILSLLYTYGMVSILIYNVTKNK